MKQKVEFIESYIKNGTGDYQWNGNHGELVRCKDCKFFCKEEKSMVANQYCSNLHRAVTNDWFCADGKRKEGRDME